MGFTIDIIAYREFTRNYNHNTANDASAQIIAYREFTRSYNIFFRASVYIIFEFINSMSRCYSIY